MQNPQHWFSRKQNPQLQKYLEEASVHYPHWHVQDGVRVHHIEWTAQDARAQTCTHRTRYRLSKCNSQKPEPTRRTIFNRDSTLQLIVQISSGDVNSNVRA